MIEIQTQSYEQAWKLLEEVLCEAMKELKTYDHGPNCVPHKRIETLARVIAWIGRLTPEGCKMNPEIERVWGSAHRFYYETRKGWLSYSL